MPHERSGLVRRLQANVAEAERAVQLELTQRLERVALGEEHPDQCPVSSLAQRIGRDRSQTGCGRVAVAAELGETLGDVLERLLARISR